MTSGRLLRTGSCWAGCPKGVLLEVEIKKSLWPESPGLDGACVNHTWESLPDQEFPTIPFPHSLDWWIHPTPTLRWMTLETLESWITETLWEDNRGRCSEEHEMRILLSELWERVFESPGWPSYSFHLYLGERGIFACLYIYINDLYFSSESHPWWRPQSFRQLRTGTVLRGVGPGNMI